MRPILVGVALLAVACERAPLSTGLVATPLHAPTSSIVPDFAEPSLPVVWGQERWEGPTDAAASASLWSDGKSLHLHVDVTDDHLVVTGDPEGSDHVEVWFALADRDEVGSTAYLEYGDDHRLYQVNGEGDVKAFLAELAHPTVEYPDDMPADERIAAADLVAREFGDRPAKPREVHVFYGVAHLGLFPDGRPAHVYDTDLYGPIEKVAGAKLGALGDGVSYSAVQRTGGYTLDATFAPQALGFVTQTSSDVRVMVDVVDADVPGAQKSLLSTSAKRRWGDPRTFDTVHLRKDMDVDLGPDLALLARGTESQSIEYVYTRGGWVRSWQERSQVGVQSSDDRYSFLHDFWRMSFAALRISSPTLVAKGRALFHLYSGDVEGARTDDESRVGGAYVVVDAGRPVHMDGVWQEFAFADGSPGLIGWDSEPFVYPPRGGACGGAVNVYLVLYRFADDASDPLRNELVTVDGCSGRATVQDGSCLLPLRAPEDPRGPAADPSDEAQWDIAWKKEGESIVLGGSGDTPVTLSWDPDGSNVKVTWPPGAKPDCGDE